MTPAEIKRKYQDLLNNEIFLSDPVAWMQDDSEFIVMTAIVGYSHRRCYAKLALCEVQKGVFPKMISERAKGMVCIWELHSGLRKDRLQEGYVDRRKNSYAIKLAEVTARCAELNARAARCSA